MAVLAGIERSATVEPIEPMVLLRFDADDFLALLDTYPEIQRALMRTLVTRLSQSNRPREPTRRAATMHGMVWGKTGQNPNRRRDPKNSRKGAACSVSSTATFGFDKPFKMMGIDIGDG